ncbi:MAG TPA: RNA polymerase sigma factor FliA [Candidatus Macondimonas sp.]|nr:RNA polymerase sigma factor FliA [Candidatus Macondimonas sp.]
MRQSAQITSREQHDLVVQHAPLVRRIAQHLASRLPASVQIDDLMQAGMIGLLEAARNYDADQGASFETYAGIRIRGAMLDETRKVDWAPRSVHRKAREMAAVVHELEHRLGRVAKPVEIAAAMQIDLDQYFQIVEDAAGCRVLSLDEPDNGVFDADEIPGDGDHDDPEQQIEADGFRSVLAEVMSGLPEKERLVMSLYYEQDLNLRQIGSVMGVSESRACQIHGQAVKRIRARMADWVEAG